LRQNFSEESYFRQQFSELLNIEDKFNNTPLLLACVYDNELRQEDREKTIKILLDYGSNPNVRNKFTGFTPLHWEARYGKVKTLELLIEKGASEFVPDEKGFRPIDYAGKFEHLEATKFLI
jgi:ankyrin repeat protein